MLISLPALLVIALHLGQAGMTPRRPSPGKLFDEVVTSSGGGTGQWFEDTVRVGQREAKPRLDSIRRIAGDPAETRTLENANVILAEDVDSRSRPQVGRLRSTRGSAPRIAGWHPRGRLEALPESCRS